MCGVIHKRYGPEENEIPDKEDKKEKDKKSKVKVEPLTQATLLTQLTPRSASASSVASPKLVLKRACLLGDFLDSVISLVGAHLLSHSHLNRMV